MNKLYKFLLVIAVALSACNPMEDIYEDLDAQLEAPKASLEYTLSDADYATISGWAKADATTEADSAMADAIKSDKAMAEGFAASYVPALLSGKYPALGKNSVAQVTYNFTNGPKTYLYDFKEAPEYEVSDDDYMQFGGALAEFKYFSPANSPEENLPTILKNSITDAAAGDMVLASYDYSTVDPVYEGEEGVIAFTMVEADYNLLVEYIKNNMNEYLDQQYFNTEYYYGASTYYKNFDLRLAKRIHLAEYAEMDEAAAEALIAARVKEGIIKMLELKLGVKAVEGMKYVVTYKTYNGSASAEPTETFICTAAGENPTFVENMEVVEMVEDDYTMLVEYIRDHPTLSGYFDTKFNNSEYYFGASSYYKNFDLRLYKREGFAEYDGLTEEEGNALIQERVTEGLIKFLELKYATTAEVGKKYQVTYAYYDGTTGGSLSRIFVCTGAEPTFEEEGTTKSAQLVAAEGVYGRGDYYQFNGSEWEAVEDVMYLSDADYDSMGSGPGKYNNFSSSAKPENYLPQFLSQTYPYAQEGMVMAVVYKYYSSGVKTYADEYTFIDGAWSIYNPVEEMTDQFINVGDKWIFDPTVKFTMEAADYQLIVDAINANSETQYLVDRGNSEYYYGASAYYTNFDLRVSKRTTGDFAQEAFTSLSTEDAVELTYTRMTEAVGIMLTAKFPNAVAQVSGVDVLYVVTVATYENDLSRGKYTVTYQCTQSGPNAEFTFVEGPTPAE